MTISWRAVLMSGFGKQGRGQGLRMLRYAQHDMPEGFFRSPLKPTSLRYEAGMAEAMP